MDKEYIRWQKGSHLIVEAITLEEGFRKMYDGRGHEILYKPSEKSTDVAIIVDEAFKIIKEYKNKIYVVEIRPPYLELEQLLEKDALPPV